MNAKISAKHRALMLELAGELRTMANAIDFELSESDRPLPASYFLAHLLTWIKTELWPFANRLYRALSKAESGGSPR